MKVVNLHRYVDEGAVTASDFDVVEGTVPEKLADGEVLVRALYLSVDPYMRGRMRNVPGYFVGPFEPGQPITSLGIGVVEASQNPEYSPGDCVTVFMPWAEMVVFRDDQLRMAKKLPPAPAGLDRSVYLGALGMTGLTAYGSLETIAKPRSGEVAFVSGAAGAVGLIVCQLLKNVYGCKVVGSAGSDEKVMMLQQQGLVDCAWNYRSLSTDEALKKYCPDGVDIYFDNVGGEMLDSTLPHMRLHGRIVACGSISQYDAIGDQRYGVKNLFHIVTKRLLMQGFICGDFPAQLRAAFSKDMTSHLLDGKVVHMEHVTHGIENAGQAFVDMMSGKNIGKAVVAVADS